MGFEFRVSGLKAKYDELLANGKISISQQKRVTDLYKKYTDLKEKADAAFSELGDIDFNSNDSVEADKYFEISREVEAVEAELCEVLDKIVKESNDAITRYNITELIKKYIIDAGLKTDKLIETIDHAKVSDEPVKYASYILPSGDFISVAPGTLHEEMLWSIVKNILPGMCGLELTASAREGFSDEHRILADYVVNELHWIKVNAGLGGVEGRCYIVLPNRQVKSLWSGAQRAAVEKLVEFALNNGRQSIAAFVGMDAEDYKQIYFENDDTAAQVVKEIVRFWNRKLEELQHKGHMTRKPLL